MSARLLVAGVAAMLLGGCGTVGSKARINPSSVARYSNDGCKYVYGLGTSRMYAIDLGCFKLSSGEGVAYNLARQYPTDRNRLEAALLMHADSICEVEKGSLVANEALSNASLSFLSTALSTVSTIVGGEQAKSILSGGAALASGTQDNVNANFYRNQLTQAITKAMDSERSKIFTDIAAKRTMGVADYPVDEMIRLVNRYHQACSFQYGLQILLDAAVNREGVNAIIQERNLSAVAENLRNAMKSPGALTTEGLEALRKKLAEVELQRATIAQASQGTNVTTND